MSILELGTLQAEPGVLPESSASGWSPPQISAVLLDRLAPWLTSTADPQGDHRNYLLALCAMAQPMWGLVMDSGNDPDAPSWVPGWGSLFDVDICPTQYLPFLAQLVGVPPAALVGADDQTARRIIRAEQGMQRGTPGAIVAAAQRFLSGNQSCTLLERVNLTGSVDAYHFVLVVRPEQVTNQAGLIAAVDAVKPGGVMWDLVQTDGWTISQMESGYATITALEAAFSTVSALEEDQT